MAEPHLIKQLLARQGAYMGYLMAMVRDLVLVGLLVVLVRGSRREPARSP